MGFLKICLKSRAPKISTTFQLTIRWSDRRQKDNPKQAPYYFFFLNAITLGISQKWSLSSLAHELET